MGIREQRIQIGYSVKSIVRCVYDIRNNDHLKFQTGYVQYDDNEIPVWRPFDSNDKSMDAPWRDGKWQSIYVLRMPQKKDSKHVAYEVSEVDFEGASLSLPKVSTELMHAFKTHLNKVYG